MSRPFLESTSPLLTTPLVLSFGSGRGDLFITSSDLSGTIFCFVEKRKTKTKRNQAQASRARARKRGKEGGTREGEKAEERGGGLERLGILRGIVLWTYHTLGKMTDGSSSIFSAPSVGRWLPSKPRISACSGEVST